LVWGFFLLLLEASIFSFRWDFDGVGVDDTVWHGNDPTLHWRQAWLILDERNEGPKKSEPG
jgi:hypothetical protein